MSGTKCLGWGALEGKCQNTPGTKWGPHWCQPCDEQRMAYLTEQFAKISASFDLPSSAGDGATK